MAGVVEGCAVRIIHVELVGPAQIFFDNLIHEINIEPIDAFHVAESLREYSWGGTRHFRPVF